MRAPSYFRDVVVRLLSPIPPFPYPYSCFLVSLSRLDCGPQPRVAIARGPGGMHRNRNDCEMSGVCVLTGCDRASGSTYTRRLLVAQVACLQGAEQPFQMRFGPLR